MDFFNAPFLFAIMAFARGATREWLPSGTIRMNEAYKQRYESGFAGWLRRHAWMPIPIFLVLVLLVAIEDVETQTDPGLLLPLMNLLFTTAISLLVAGLAVRTWLRYGSWPVLLLGSAMLSFGTVGALAGAFIFFGDVDDGVTVFNAGAFFAGLCHLASALWLLLPIMYRPPKRRWIEPLAVYGVTVAVLAALVLAAHYDYLPPFFETTGPTPLRQVVLATTIVMFALSGMLLWALNMQARSASISWYAMGMGLIAIGLTGVFGLRHVGSPVAWAGRFVQYLGGIYILASVIQSAREGALELPFAQVRRIRERLELAAEAAGLGVFEWDIVNKRMFWENPQMYAIFGRDPGDGIDNIQSLGRALHPEEIRSFVQAVAASKTPGNVFHVVCRLRQPDSDNLRWVEFSGKCEFALDDTPLRLLGVVQDITARKESEAALRKSRDWLNLALDAMRAGVSIWDLQADRSEWNLRQYELYGLPPGDVEPSIFAMLHRAHPEDRQDVLEQLQTAIAQHRDFNAEYRIVRADGEERWVRSTRRFSYDACGNPLSSIGVMFDITERKRAEDALRESEEWFHTLADNMSQFAWMADSTGAVIWYNKRWYEYTGTRPEEVRAWGWQKLHHPDHVKRVTERYQWCVRTGEPWEDIFPLRGANGEFRWFLSRAVPIRDEEGKVVRWFGTNTDVTRHREAEDAMRRSEALFRRIADANLIGVGIGSTSGRTDYINDEMLRMMGRSRREFDEGRVDWKDCLAPRCQADIPEWIARIQRDGADIGYERTFNHPDGTQLHYIGACALLEPGSDTYVSIAVDITKRKAAEDALRELNETLEQRVDQRTAQVQELALRLRALAAELSQVEQRERKRLARVLHDHIQQLLVAARIQLEWIRRDKRPERIASTVQAVDSILREAITESRSLTVELSPPVLHETGLIGGLHWLAARMLEKSQFTVHLKADSAAEPATEEVRFLLFECVRELLFNALKHSEANEATMTVSRLDDSSAKVVVRDEGRGFDPAALRNRKAGEATFGLFSIQQRLVHIGGEMTITSAPGEGATITLTAPMGEAAVALPTAPAGRKADSPQHRKAAAAAIKDQRRRVLIVDDHQIMRQGLSGILQLERDIEVVGEAADGPEAIRLAESLRPDVIIMDVNLGEMSGVDATRAILDRQPGAKVVGLSMHSDRSVAAAMRDAGAIAYLTKGGPSEDLVAAIRAC